jgi:WD40 repeat protein
MYSVHSLRDLAWWRGHKPLAATWAGLDRRSREEALRRSHQIVFGRDGISTASGGSVWFLGDRFLRFFEIGKPGTELHRVGFDDGRRRIPLALPWGGWLALSREGHILATDRRGWSEEFKAPPLIHHPDLKLVDGGPDRTLGEPASLGIVEVPESVSISFSGDDGTLACLSYFAYAAGGEARTQPLIYDLSSDWRVAYPQYQTRSVFPEPHSPRRPVSPELVLSRDGRLAALRGDQTLLRVFETRTGRSLWSFGLDAMGADVRVTCLAFSDDGEVLVTGDNSGRVRLWDTTSGRFIREFPVNVGNVATVGFHPDDRTVAIVAENEDAIRLWNYDPRSEPPAVLDHGDEVWGLAFLGGGGALASVGDDKQIQVWDLSSGAPVGRRRESNLLSAVAAAGPARPSHLALAGFAGELSVLSADAGDAKPVLRFKELEGKKLRTVAWSPDATSLVAGGDGEKVLVVSWQGSTARTRLLDTPHRNVYALAFSPDGGTLAMGSHDRAITLWDIPEFRVRATLPARAPVACVAYSPDGRTLVSGDIEGGLQFRDMPEGNLRSTRTRASDTGGVWALAFSPDGKTLAAGGDDKMVRLWDPEMALERLALSGHEAKVHAIAFSPDGTALASGDFAGKIRLWRTGP